MFLGMKVALKRRSNSTGGDHQQLDDVDENPFPYGQPHSHFSRAKSTLGRGEASESVRAISNVGGLHARHAGGEEPPRPPATRWINIETLSGHGGVIMGR